MVLTNGKQRQTLLERILLNGHDADIYVQAIQNTLPALVERDPLLGFTFIRCTDRGLFR